MCRREQLTFNLKSDCKDANSSKEKERERVPRPQQCWRKEGILVLFLASGVCWKVSSSESRGRWTGTWSHMIAAGDGYKVVAGLVWWQIFFVCKFHAICSRRLQKALMTKYQICNSRECSKFNLIARALSVLIFWEDK